MELPSALYLIPVTLGDAPLERVLPQWNASVVGGIRHFIVEDIRSARRFLRLMDREFPIDDCTFMEMGKHADERRFAGYLKPLEEGLSVGVISEAGCPAVADPGAAVVALAQQRGYGYLPVDPADRAKRLKALETRAWNEGQTQLFIETPFRNHKMFQALIAALRPQTRLCIAAGITTPDEWICTHTVQEWKRIQLPDLSKIPAVFLIGK